MEFGDLVRTRRMTRSFDPERAVPPGVIADVLDLATRAPSAGFSQGWRFLVLDTPDAVAGYWAASAGAREPDAWLAGMQTAPALVLVWCSVAQYEQRYARADKDRSTSRTDSRSVEQRWPTPYWYVDAGMASMLILLGAASYELGACFFGLPAVVEPVVRQRFSVPDELRFVGTIALGYPAAQPKQRSARRRQTQADLVRWNSF